MNIKIVVDSSSDMPQKFLEEFDIDVLHVPVTDGEHMYKDGIDLDINVMYENMKKGTVYKTSQVALKDYIEKYTYYAKNNIPMLSLVMSSGISSSHTTSQLAINSVKEEYKDAQIYSVDSKCCSLGYGYVSYIIAKSASMGHNIQELMELLEFLQNNLVSIATVDDLTYVARGGRLPNMAAFIANSLNIKPFLHADDGSLHLFDKVRGTKKMFKKYIDILGDRNETTDFKKSVILLEKSDDEQMIVTLRDMIKKEYSLSDENFIFSTIGSTIGAHTGPGAMCMFFMKNPIPDRFF